MARPTPSLPAYPFYTLPSELILDIVDMLPPDAFINFAFANYPLLFAYGLAPGLSPATVSHLARQTRITTHLQLLPFPAEVTLQILSRLKPIDIMNYVLANYQNLAAQGIAPALTPETIQQLRRSAHISTS
ncbi:hypothetical protein MBLNU459_g1733t1 [Dothideomycetes sp. NU459]